MTKKKSIRFRKWLNKAGFHSTGLVFIDAEDLHEDHPFLSLAIADCSRQINLDFAPNYTSVSTLNSSIANARHKLSVLRAALDKIDEGLDYFEAEGPKVIEERKAKKKKKKS